MGIQLLSTPGFAIGSSWMQASVTEQAGNTGSTTKDVLFNTVIGAGADVSLGGNAKTLTFATAGWYDVAVYHYLTGLITLWDLEAEFSGESLPSMVQTSGAANLIYALPPIRAAAGDTLLFTVYARTSAGLWDISSVPRGLRILRLA